MNALDYYSAGLLLLCVLAVTFAICCIIADWLDRWTPQDPKVRWLNELPPPTIIYPQPRRRR